jgi:hypothetical protein
MLHKCSVAKCGSQSAVESWSSPLTTYALYSQRDPPHVAGRVCVAVSQSVVMALCSSMSFSCCARGHSVIGVPDGDFRLSDWARVTGDVDTVG